VEQDNRKNEPVYSKKLRAGRRRTYFFDIRPTRSNDYYLTITESKKRYNEDGYDRHKIFLYKEDFNKFLDGLTQTIDYVKTELLPEYDFDEFSKNYDDYDSENELSNEDIGVKNPPLSEGQQNVEEENKKNQPDEPSKSPEEEDEDLKWD